MLTVVQSCAAVQATTLWNVLITPVIPMKSVVRSMECQAAIRKVKCPLSLMVEGVNSDWFPSFPTSAIASLTMWLLTRVCPLSFLSAETSTCVASGDPHYTTFDKRRYNFMGNCSYVMSKPCNTTTLPYFEVHADNENRYNKPKISYLKAVHVYVYDVKISILKGGTVQVRYWQSQSFSRQWFSCSFKLEFLVPLSQSCLWFERWMEPTWSCPWLRPQVSLCWRRENITLWPWTLVWPFAMMETTLWTSKLSKSE